MGSDQATPSTFWTEDSRQSSSMHIRRRGNVGRRIEWLDAECSWISKIQGLSWRKLGSTKSNLSCKLLRWILKEHSTITFLLRSQAVDQPTPSREWYPQLCNGSPYHVLCPASGSSSCSCIWSNLTAAVAPCFRDVCGNTCDQANRSPALQYL